MVSKERQTPPRKTINIQIFAENAYREQCDAQHHEDNTAVFL